MEIGEIDLPEENENTPLITAGYDRDDINEEIELNTLDQTGRKTSTSKFDPYGGLPRRKETSFIDERFKKLREFVDPHEKIYSLKISEENMGEAWRRIKDKFPEFNPGNSPFTAKIDEFGRVMVRLNRINSKDKPFFDGDKLNEKLSKTIKESLGPPAEEIITEIEENNSRDRARVKELREEARRTDISDEVRETTTNRANEVEERIDERNQASERIQERMSLRNRIKMIFKKYGFTVTVVVAAVGAIIGVIVSNLSSGLSKMAKGVGNGLKDIGKKLAQILPGMVGAIASFIFRTAGEVIGFLAKNAWLLIVAVVVYFVESLKNKKKR